MAKLSKTEKISSLVSCLHLDKGHMLPNKSSGRNSTSAVGYGFACFMCLIVIYFFKMTQTFSILAVSLSKLYML